MSKVENTTSQIDLRARAANIVKSVNTQLDALEDSVPMDRVSVAGARLPGVLGLMFRVIDSVDPTAAGVRVDAAKARYPHLDQAALARRLIRDKALQTGAVGASTSAAGTIPGLGTLAAMTLGVTADIVATFRLQVELVMELAHLMGYELSRTERRTAILAITGLGAGLDTAFKAVGTRVMARVGERYAERTILKALPVIGILASAGVNVLATQVVGDRAVAYFKGKHLGEFTQDLTGVSAEEETLVERLWRSGQNQARVLADTINPAVSAARQWTAERAGVLLSQRPATDDIVITTDGQPPSPTPTAPPGSPNPIQRLIASLRRKFRREG